eukprot:scaffold10540_cov116-Isochrysis_galbana.AAC.4
MPTAPPSPMRIALGAKPAYKPATPSSRKMAQSCARSDRPPPPPPPGRAACRRDLATSKGALKHVANTPAAKPSKAVCTVSPSSWPPPPRAPPLRLPPPKSLASRSACMDAKYTEFHAQLRQHVA